MGRHSKKDPYTKKIEEAQKKRRIAEKRAKEINKEWGFLDPLAPPSTPPKNNKRKTSYSYRNKSSYSYMNKSNYSYSSGNIKLVNGDGSVWDNGSNLLAAFLLFVFVFITTGMIFVGKFNYDNFYVVIPVSLAIATISVVLYGKGLKKSQVNDVNEVNELKEIENDNLSMDDQDISNMDNDTCLKIDENANFTNDESNKQIVSATSTIRYF